jgi:uncharacterized protein YciI
MPLYVRTLLVTGPPEEVEAALTGHREHLRELRDQGKLRSAGEFKSGEGCLEIFEAADLREAQRIGEASPLVADGLATWIVREWVETTTL